MEKRCPGQERAIKDARDIDEGTYRQLVGRRAREVCFAELGPVETEDRRRELETQLEEHYEKIFKGADFLPARFLRDGAAAARAVCRIVVGGSGYGTGFLVARGLLMTNNHVLESAEEARASAAEFGFEEGGSLVRVALEPERFFRTDPGLDYTIVACDASALGDVAPIALLRSPATVTRNEAVNIIQHPQARQKEIAIHENKVTRVLDKVLRYETDTEPGSSGSPVFNNRWQLVGLHHAGWVEQGTTVNEGVRISAIVAHLLTGREESSRDPALRELLEGIPDSSPYLGFFDVDGAGDPGSVEISLPDYRGTAKFADVGVWNIEHFNSEVSDTRVRDVADVAARLALDVFGLTEVERGAMDRLVRELGRRGLAMGHEIVNTPGSQDIAILYDRDTSEVELWEEMYKRHAKRLAAKTSAGLSAFPRHPLFAKCRVGNGNEAVDFAMVVVHLKAFGDSQSRARRRLAAKKLAEIVEDIREHHGLPVVIGGDFNERIDTGVLSALARSPDLFAMTADDAAAGGISYVGDSHRSLIDHLLVSGDLDLADISGDDAAIVRLDKTVSGFAKRVSDHVPLVFRMVLRDKPIELEPVEAPAGVAIDVPEGKSKVRVRFEVE